jgi:hypothetical protein
LPRVVNYFTRWTVNPDFFESITSEVQAYVLGFLAADASVFHYGFRIILARRDRAQLEKIRAALASDVPIFDYINASFGKILPFSSLAIHRRKLVTDLAALGVGPKKSLTIRPWQGPICLMPHYWRGVFDGDGSLGPKPPNDWRLGLCGSRFITEAFAGFVTSHTGSRAQARHRNGKGCWEVCYYGRYQCRRIVALLYKEATIFLDRKRAIADALLATSNRDHRGESPG